MGAHPVFMHEENCRFNRFSVIILAAFLMKMYTLKFTWQHKNLQIAKIILQKNKTRRLILSNLKTYTEL